MTGENSDNKAMSDSKLLAVAREAMHAESEAIKMTASKLGPELSMVVRAFAALSGKVVVTGLGKSGHIARKIAATLASTGTPSFYLHPSEALHGDLGMISAGDALLAIAFGGETTEVVDVAKHAKRLGRLVVCITGKTDSSLSKLSDFILDGSIGREVCPLNLAPTASTAVALALGDALAVTLMHVRGFSEVDFAALHPGGSLGRKLSLVSDHMRPLTVGLATVTTTTHFHQVLEAVTKQNLGIVPVLDRDQSLIGAISDGDIRRALLKSGASALQLTAEDIMTKNPRTISGLGLALEAFQTMERHQITSLFVQSKDDPSKLAGIIRMHDLLAAKIV